jgi:uncharacterized protein YyaL (SSP411 family)/DMSO/TMAO reductase YedYZ molybdopterin-dependent catalytic subunit
MTNHLEQRPIFLSIGYSACHWCHVMAHESFEDEQVAAILNGHFVSIKVDREERPDVDRIYMDAVQSMTGRGGWPLSVFLTPDGYPFYGGTYFPPAARYGIPSFPELLYAIVNAWTVHREEIQKDGRRVVAAIELQSQVRARTTALGPETIEAAFSNLQQTFDRVAGGWGDGPKFPQPMILEFLLRYHHTTQSGQALQMVTETLEAMARGGIYDQYGGGFHRYSVDNHWLIPHFEKMLYDNAQLARVYLHAWQVTGSQFFRAITEEILDYVVREMTDSAGGFYSTQDADSEGVEGRFFLWARPELHAALRGESDLFLTTYGVAEQANFEGKNILHLAGGLDQRSVLTESRRKLFSIREQRVHPNRDEKILTSWNGLMLAAFAEAARVLNRSDYLKVAERNADFVPRDVRQADGCLLHVWKSGKASISGYLEDYCCLVEGLLELHQTTFDLRWYLAARALTETMLTHFRAADGTLWDTSDDHKTLFTRPRGLQDNATPSGNSMAATTLLRLAGLTGESHYVEFVQQAFADAASDGPIPHCLRPMARRFRLCLVTSARNRNCGYSAGTGHPPTNRCMYHRISPPPGGSRTSSGTGQIAYTAAGRPGPDRWARHSLRVHGARVSKPHHRSRRITGIVRPRVQACIGRHRSRTMVQISRRHFARLALGGMALAILNACTFKQTLTPGTSPTETGELGATPSPVSPRRPILQNDNQPGFYVRYYKPFEAIDPTEWSLSVEGLVTNPLKLSLSGVQALPLVSQVSRMKCVECWSAAAEWEGFHFSSLLDLTGPLPSAKWVHFHCADGYYESLTLDALLDEHVIFVHRMNDQTLPDIYGAPLRLIIPPLYGYKNPKAIVRLVLAEEELRGYWSTVGAYSQQGVIQPGRDHPLDIGETRQIQGGEVRYPDGVESGE